VFWAKKWTKIGSNHRVKVMFFARTQRKLPRHPTNVEKAALFKPPKLASVGFKICFLYPNKSH